MPAVLDPPRVRGVCPVVETPFTSEGQVDPDSLAKLVDHLAARGTRSVLYPGFASEFLTLTPEERTSLTQVVIERAHEHGMLAVGSVSDHGTTVAVRRAVALVEDGADMVNVLPPYQLSPSAAAVRAHVDAILSAIAPVPLILQVAPAQTGVAFDAAALGQLAQESPNFAQVKVEATPPGRFITALAKHAPTLTSIVGYAGLQLPDAYRRGAVAVQPGCSFTEIYLEIERLWRDGEIAGAESLHRRLLPYVSYWMQDVNLIVAAEKRVSALRGIIPADHCRAPAYELDALELEMVDRFLAEFDAYFSTPSVG